MPASAVLALALLIPSDTGMVVGKPVEIVAPGDFPVIGARIAKLRAFRRRIDGVLDPTDSILRFGAKASATTGRVNQPRLTRDLR